MRIGMDARKAADYGIGTYIRNIAREMVRLDRQAEWVFFHRPGEESLLPSGPRVALVPTSAAHYSLGELRTLTRLAREHRVDLYHAPHYVLPVGLPCPAVVTIHDVIHLAAGEYGLLPRLYARALIAHAVRRAGRVITDSRFSAGEITSRFPRAGAKLTVIPLGVEEHFLSAPPGDPAAGIAELIGAGGPYLLFVGNPKGHKNLDLLLTGFVALSRRYPDLRLVAVGGDDRQRRDLLGRVRRLGIEPRTRIVAPVEQEALARLYGGAAVFVFPSRLEGFGLPPLEAMACGAPVAASSAASLPEVLGPAAIYFSPESADSLVGAICRVLDEPALRDRVVRLGRERARLFAWEDAASRTLAVYRETLGP